MKRRVVLAVLLGSGLAAGVDAAPGRAVHSTIRTKPPWYVGASKGVEGKLGFLPAQAGGSFGIPAPAPDLTGVVEPFLPRLEAQLEELGWVRLGARSAGSTQEGPEAYVGAPEGFYAPEDLSPFTEGPMAEEREAVLIHVVDPPRAWKDAMVDRARSSGVAAFLLVRLELTDYPVSQVSWKGTKAVHLGTGHRQPVPWLTTLDHPVEVLQLTGVMYGADGRFLRAGAEGIQALRTPFRESVVDLQRAMKPEHLAAALESRREDLPGEPLAWQVALRNLVAQLAGRKELLLQP